MADGQYPGIYDDKCQKGNKCGNLDLRRLTASCNKTSAYKEEQVEYGD
ncbi:MAG: hypothetical protein OQK98_03510 [Gammaproteobacteria bacterium]|nr:hypothetical protein [Gammaproteobacteria bacterium]